MLPVASADKFRQVIFIRSNNKHTIKFPGGYHEIKNSEVSFVNEQPDHAHNRSDNRIVTVRSDSRSAQCFRWRRRIVFNIPDQWLQINKISWRVP